MTLRSKYLRTVILEFNIDGKTIPYNEVPAPVYKDYKLANSILKTNESVYKSGQPMTKTESDMYRLQLEEALQDPNSLRSLVYDFDSELGMRDIGNIWDSNKNKDGAVEEVRAMVINRLLKARVDVASEGAAEKKERKLQAKNLQEVLVAEAVTVGRKTMLLNTKARMEKRIHIK